MNIYLTTYKNTYFNFYINFSSDWDFRTKSYTRKNTGMQYQVSDNDLPKENGEHKILFFATYRLENFFAERCNFSVSVHRFKDSFDLLLFAQEKSDVVDCKYSKRMLLGRDAQEVTITQECNENRVITKVITWMEFPDIWLSAIAEGNSFHNFEKAESLFHKMHRITS